MKMRQVGIYTVTDILKVKPEPKPQKNRTTSKEAEGSSRHA
jgi:hypothetical protein